MLTRPDTARGEADHLTPAWLPGGRGLVFTISARAGGLDGSRVAVLDRDTGAWHVVIEGGYGARYVEGGYLVYRAAGALWAVPFDVSRLETRGTPVRVLPHVPVGGMGRAAQFDVAVNGTLVYPDAWGAYLWVPVWVDREGRETPLDVPSANWGHPRLSPDGRRLALRGGLDIFLWEIDRPWATRSQITSSRAQNWFPVWTPDSRRIVFGSWRGGGFSNLYVQDADSTQAERLTDSPDMQIPTSITPDGSTVVFHSFTRRLEGLRLDAPDSAERQFVLVETSGDERNGDVSPDGRWLAYEAESSPGRLDIYVRPLPDVGRGPRRVTRDGGTYPVWARSGRELFYLRPDGTVVAVPVEAGTSWQNGSPIDLFRGPYAYREDSSLGRNYDVAPDGQRFLMLKDATGTRQPHFVVVQNWTAELARLTGGR